MADTNRRYYWLKLSEGFFQQKEIKQLRRIAGGDTFTIIYLKMLLRSLEDGGRLYYEGIEDDFVSELALDLDEDVENVKMTVAFLTAKNILVQGGDDEYELLTAGEMTGSETESTRRSRKSRAKNAQPMLQCNADATKRIVDIEIEKEIEIEREIDKEKEKEIRGKTARRFVPPTVQDVEAYIREKGYGVDAVRFVDFYESKGWMVGKNRMKDWRAAVRTWASSGRSRSPDGESRGPLGVNDEYI